MWFGELFIGENMEIWGQWYTCRGHGKSELFPHTLPYAFLPSGLFLSYILYNTLLI